MKKVILIFLLLASCSGKDKNFSMLWGSENSHEVTSAKGYQSEDKKSSEIKITWRASKKKVDKYYLYYGYAPEHLNYREEILVSDLKKIIGSDKSVNYSYSIDNLDKNKAVYFSLQAANDKGLSPATRIMKIDPP